MLRRISLPGEQVVQVAQARRRAAVEVVHSEPEVVAADSRQAVQVVPAHRRAAAEVVRGMRLWAAVVVQELY